MHRTITVPRPSFAPAPLPGHPSALAARLRRWGAAFALFLGLLPLRPAQGQPAPTPTASAPASSVIVSVNASEPRKMSTGKRIKTVNVSDPRIVRVVAGPTPDVVFIAGQAPGIATVALTDESTPPVTDRFEVVVVAFDIQQLRNVLRRAVPTANISPIPAGNNGVILAGTTDRAEDVPLALQAAQSVVGGVQIINALRVGGVQQVQLDVVVAQVSRSELRTMAFDFLLSDANFFLGSTVGSSVVNPPLVGLNSTFLSAQGIVAGQPGTPNGLPTNFFFGFLDPNSGFIGFLQALRSEGVLKLLAEPRLVAQSGRQASFLSGGEQAIPVPAGLGQIGVQFEEFGTRLNFVPIVLGNGRIHLEVEPEVSFLDPASGTNIQGTVVPGRSTQRVRTTVEMESGQTFVIGGLIQHTVTGSTLKTPILGDLPFIGAFWNSKVYNEVETELLVLVTPYLIDAMDCAQYPKCLPGQETRSPDDFELFLEGILEAPRGARDVCPGGHYQPAFKNGPTAGMFPCAGNGGHNGGGCVGCGGHGLATPAMLHGEAIAPGHYAASGTAPPVPHAAPTRAAQSPRPSATPSPTRPTGRHTGGASPASLPPGLTSSGGPSLP